MVLTDNPPKPIDILTEDEIDYKTIEAYKTKLMSKSKTYNGGLLILSDYESPSQTVAFSRTTPIDYYALLIYSNGIEKKENYAHEIAHMLGLPHSFYTDKEKEAYNNARENILGNGKPPKKPDGTPNNDYKGGILKTIQKTKSSDYTYYPHIGITSLKGDILKSLDNLIAKEKDIIFQNNKDKERIKTIYKNYPDSHTVNATQTKAQYINVCDTYINTANRIITENNLAKEELSNKNSLGYVRLDSLANYIKTDYLNLLNQNYKYYESVINQIHYNYITLKQGSTKNIMDYNNTKVMYLHNQIKTMRDDIKNYMSIQCEFCNPSTSKKSISEKK
ncbi:hypothetical protein [Flavobacterium hibisci]|uniref:hypothetical protein n=1 Tax=Flavobacterium hibisci TaxID=1914462 RepID=UPI001CBB2A87|nr:hypothetical protein [Flavobacterium hibisci]MBZ4043816.1 hypothetical protein [Flavobacterium hibisci]